MTDSPRAGNRDLRSTYDLETSLVNALTEEFIKPATEPLDIALLQEIWTWLRSMPDTERLNRAHRLAADGDKAALRPLLTAPTYLTGVVSRRIGA